MCHLWFVYQEKVIGDFGKVTGIVKRQKKVLKVLATKYDQCLSYQAFHIQGASSETLPPGQGDNRMAVFFDISL